MNKTAKWITRSAISIALIILFQFVTKALGQQLVTGSLVNLVLALAALLFGAGVGAAAAIVSPFVAFLLGINAQIAVVPAIAVGNLCYVLVIVLLVKLMKNVKLPERVKNIIAVIGAALVKFAIQYLLIVKWIAPAFLPAKAQPTIAASFGIMQFFTACIGGVIASLIAPLVKKGLKAR